MAASNGGKLDPQELPMVPCVRTQAKTMENIVRYAPEATSTQQVVFSTFDFEFNRSSRNIAQFPVSMTMRFLFESGGLPVLSTFDYFLNRVVQLNCPKAV